MSGRRGIVHSALGRRGRNGLCIYGRRIGDQPLSSCPRQKPILDRRSGRPLMPKWVTSAQAWVPVLVPRRRKGEERRSPLVPYNYHNSRDPRIRIMERRIHSAPK